MELRGSENLVEEIKSRCNIVDVIGQVVTLKKAGSNYKGLCPFHNEKTPSFMVSETRQRYTCFGCGASGDVIGFMQEYYRLDFKEAVEKLAERCGLEAVSLFPARTDNRRLYEINREAAVFFYKNFFGQENPGRIYMEKRGIRAETLKKFGIGYADPGWSSLYDHLTRKGFEAKLLLQLGLVSESKGKYFDRFRNRVIFPIIDTRGKVIGFGGRTLGDENPKYLNSPESSVFLKKNNLYGLSLTRREMDREQGAVLVEGYMDVIALYQYGIRSAAASLGTALTENQARLLKRFTNRVYLAYDSDQAGQAAALRGMEILRGEGMKVRVLEMEGSKDPDEYIRKNGKEAFLRLRETAPAFVDYKLKSARKKYDLEDPENRIDFLREAADILRRLSPVEAEAYILRLSEETRIPENAIRFEMRGGGAEPARPTPAVSGPEGRELRENPEEEPMDQLEKHLIRLSLASSDYIPRIRQLSRPFSSRRGSRMMEALIRLREEKGDAAGETELEALLEEEDRAALAHILDTVPVCGNEEAIFADCVRTLRQREVREAEKELLFRLSMADEEENAGKIREWTEELIRLQREKTQE